MGLKTKLEEATLHYHDYVAFHCTVVTITVIYYIGY